MAASETISYGTMLSSLEPLCGAALALCLSYLALDRFRYRNTIQAISATELKDEARTGDGVHHTTPFKALLWLAGSMVPHHCKIALGKETIERPSGVIAALYAVFFKRSIGEGVIAFLGLVAFLIMITGVFHNTQQLMWIPQAFEYTMPIWAVTFILILGCVFPVSMVALGRMCVSWSHDFSKKMSEEMQKTADRMQQDLREIEPPKV